MKAVFRGEDGLVPEIGAVSMGNASGTRPSPSLHELALLMKSKLKIGVDMYIVDSSLLAR
jgi:hypothetical protein